MDEYVREDIEWSSMNDEFWDEYDEEEPKPICICGEEIEEGKLLCDNCMWEVKKSLIDLIDWLNLKDDLFKFDEIINMALEEIE